MLLAQLRRQFRIRNVLDFDEWHGLTRLLITAPSASATMLMQGAHLTDWQPRGEDPVLFLSRKSDLAPGKPIRGGVPIVFPWFAADQKADRIDGHPGPTHGFARTEVWSLASAELAGQDLRIILTLGPAEMSRSLGFSSFLLTLKVQVGVALTMELTVSNPGTESLTFEQAFHNYFAIEDIHEVVVDGLESSSYIDKTDDRRLKPAAGLPVRFGGPVDRVYQHTTAPATVHSGVQRRDIHLRKRGSESTIVWNPARPLPDLGEWDWHEMVAVETANVGEASRTLGPGESFVVEQTISVERWKR